MKLPKQDEVENASMFIRVGNTECPKRSLVWKFMIQNKKKTNATCNKCMNMMKHLARGSQCGKGRLKKGTTPLLTNL